jgi:hypothetical protein
VTLEDPDVAVEGNMSRRGAVNGEEAPERGRALVDGNDDEVVGASSEVPSSEE